MTLNVYLLRLAFALILAERSYRLIDMSLRSGVLARALPAAPGTHSLRRRALVERWGGTLAALLVFMVLLAACVMAAQPAAPGYLSPEGINLLATPPAPLARPSAILPPPVRWQATATGPATAAAGQASPLATSTSPAPTAGTLGRSPVPTPALAAPVSGADVTAAVAVVAPAPAFSPTVTPAVLAPTVRAMPRETDPALARSLRATLQAERIRPFIPTPTPVPAAPAPAPGGQPTAVVIPLTPVPPSDTSAAVITATATSTLLSAPGRVITEHVSFIGDSIMLGAAAQIRELGNVDVDARVSRQVGEVLQILRARAAANTLGPIVVLHIGNNGTLTPQEFDEIMALLAGQRQVIFLTIKVPRVWAGPNNAVLAAGAPRYPNVTLLDWAGLTAGRAGLFWADGMHLRPEGARFYTDLIVANLKP